MTTPILCWHVHHDILVEPLTEPIKYRIAYIKENKPKDEIETRLRLMKVVQGKFPETKAYAELDKAYAELDKAYAELDKACAEWDKARAEWRKADAKYISALHEKECPGCPWDGTTIFPYK